MMNPKIPYPNWTFGAVAFGILFLFIQQIIAVVLILFGVATIGMIYKKNSVDKLCINVYMNNGETYSLTSENIDFLYKVAAAIEHCMNECNGQCYIDFKANEIKDCNFAIGDYNSVD